MQIRKADIDDGDAFLRLRIAMRRERDTGFDEAINDFIPNTRRFFDKNIVSGDFVLFFMQDGDTIAAMGGITVFETPPNQKMPHGRMAHLSSMYTVPEYRGRGLASNLLKKLVGEATVLGCDLITLNASPMGKPLYLKHGFKEAENELALALR